ncbi:hypothetical protein OOK60_10925 [Trichothermofontia sichuanensis B231]|uniref:hypothetical protein n=1 Tax=Trichothermofontia sichuanensis TaxID=3045816 RepID=UPI0022452BF9|nr:hypothetical protein [Trichothermofontia sichuanensis]UZQ53033.1 hypothetical protein OOK60_10925 [Trichothermofontia sichuanensis B231]
MHPQIEALLDQAENRYLKPEELVLLDKYVNSLPDRLETYRRLRDQEVTIMQQAVDQVQIEMPQVSTVDLERSIKNTLLVVRYCAMSMLLDDVTFIQERLLGWLSRNVQVYNTQAIDRALYRHLEKALTQALGPKSMSFLQPFLVTARDAVLNPGSSVTA